MTVELQQRIIERIQRMGPISFHDYMQMALYEPNYGYYVTGAAKMGWEGDYYTSSDVSSLFAHCMGRQLMQMWERLERPNPFLVREQGAGRGDLARQLLKWTEREHSDMFTALTYQTEDIRDGLDAIVANSNDIPVSVLLSNELVDAFPVHVVEKHGTSLYEVFVDVHHGRLYEVLDEPSSAEVANYLDSYNIPWRTYDENWRAEIHLDALRWMQRSAQLLNGPTKRGFLLTIDYGDKADALYTRERQRGTLACYYQHQLTERPLVKPGEQDITAHVNFTALINEGQRQGLHLHTFTTQKAWLEAMELNEEVERLRQSDFAAMDTERASDKGQKALLQWYTLRQRVAALTDTMGMGNFKVLVMQG